MIDDGILFGRGIAFPPHINEEGRMAWSEGTKNIRESIRIILLTETGERLMLPAFGGGLKSFLFEPNTVTTHRLIEERITQALGRWEPRIIVESVAVEPDPEDNSSVTVTIHYRLVANQAAEKVTLSLNLAG